jgi:molybdopterin synthase catalytic subunit
MTREQEKVRVSMNNMLRESMEYDYDMAAILEFSMEEYNEIVTHTVNKLQTSRDWELMFLVLVRAEMKAYAIEAHEAAIEELKKPT